LLGLRAVALLHLPIRHLALLQNLTFFLAAFGITLMAVHLGAWRSAYMHGISMVCLVHAAVIPSAWRRTLPLYLCIGLIFPMMMLLVAFVSPVQRADWFNAAAMAGFASNYVFVMASSVVATACGHAVWSAQQQVYRARRLGVIVFRLSLAGAWVRFG
jgi:serine/threonine-protein kinase